MTPLQIEILLHYNRSPGCLMFATGPYPDIIDQFVSDGLLDSYNGGQRFKITDRGRAMVEFLCAVPLPVAKWVLPEGE